MRSFTWNQFPIKNLLIDSLLTPIVESTYLKQESVVKFPTAGWKQCEWVCDVDIGLVDLMSVATWRVDLGTKKVGHHCTSLYFQTLRLNWLNFFRSFKDFGLCLNNDWKKTALCQYASLDVQIVAFLQFWLLSLQGLVISVHMSFYLFIY